MSRDWARTTPRSTWPASTTPSADPDTFGRRFGHVLDYMARVELEVDRNVLELMTMLPDPPEVDRRFYADVWQPQEIRHGLILDELQMQRSARPPGRPRTPTRVGGRSSSSGPWAAHRRPPGRHPDALLPHRDGHRALRGARLQPAPRRRETSSASTRRQHGHRADPPQEPGHYAFYQLSARGLGEHRPPGNTGWYAAPHLLRAGWCQQRANRRPTSAT